MKLCLLILVLAGSTMVVRAEDCPLILNQRFQLHFNQWQISQGAASTSTSATQAVYEVDAAVPIFTYRLGALALNGALEYNRLAYGSQAEAETGLNRYGMRLSLFPYRPLKLWVDYQHTQSPDLLGSGSLKGETWGAGATYHSRLLQDVRLSYRRGESNLEAAYDNWSQWKLESHHRGPTTMVDFDAFRQDYRTLAGQEGWHLDSATLETQSNYHNHWVLRTRSQIQDMGADSWFNLDATFYGPIGGAWHSLSTVSAGASTSADAAGGSLRTTNSFASESLVYGEGRWHSYATGAMSRSLTDAAGQDTRADSGTLGGTYTLAQDWRVHGDVGVSSLQQGLPGLSLGRTTTTMNLGLARGGDVPELIRQSLFFLSDWAFNLRAREDYPPDYVPSELAQELFRRRMRQSGSFGFTADLWRISDTAGTGQVDWARVTGQVQTHGHLTLYMAGDYKHDSGLATPGLDTRSSDLLVNGSYRLGVTSITASLGYSSASQRATHALADAGPAGTSQNGLSRSSSLGATSRLGKVPVGIMLQRYDSALSPGATTLYTWGDLTFRHVSLRLRYEDTRMDNGYRSNRITVDLLRWFDTICTRPWR